MGKDSSSPHLIIFTFPKLEQAAAVVVWMASGGGTPSAAVAPHPKRPRSFPSPPSAPRG